MAARAVLSGVANATPKSGDGEVEMIRMLKSAKDSAVKARTQAVNQTRALVVTAPAQFRETLDGLSPADFISRCARLCPGNVDGPTAAPKYALRSLACCCRQLSQEIKNLETELSRVHPYSIACVTQHFRHRSRHSSSPTDGRRQ